MDGIEEDYLGKINLTKYKKLFLDFDETITKDTGSMPLINNKEYRYADFMERSLESLE